jgi:hypothetical protein
MAPNTQNLPSMVQAAKNSWSLESVFVTVAVMIYVKTETQKMKMDKSTFYHEHNLQHLILIPED